MATLAERVRAHHKLSEADSVGVKAVFASVKEATPGTVTAVANTASIDLDDEVVVPGGAEVDDQRQPLYFKDAKAIYLNHDYSLMPIGTLRNARLTGGGWVIQWAPAKTALAADCMSLIADGCLNGMSIGFIHRDSGPMTDDEVRMYGMASSIVRRWTWLETSLTAMPCNPEAWIQGEKSAPTEAVVEKVRKALERRAIRRETAELLGVEKSKKVVRIWSEGGCVSFRDTLECAASLPG